MYRDDDDDERGEALDDRELPNRSDMDSFDEPSLEACPYCRKMIHDDTVQCPHCGNYISAEDAPRKPLPRWFLVGLVLAGACVLTWVLLRN